MHNSIWQINGIAPRRLPGEHVDIHGNEHEDNTASLTDRAPLIDYKTQRYNSYWRFQSVLVQLDCREWKRWSPARRQLHTLRLFY